MHKEYLLTKIGYNKLREELNDLKSVSRLEIAGKIKDARDAGGDVNENTLYDSAIEEQGHLEGRIAEIEDILGNCKIVEEKPSDGTVVIGSIVVVEIDGTRDEFTIVGSAESDPVLNLISNESPVGMAVLGAKEGDMVEVKTPAFIVVYKIIQVK